MFTSLIRHSAPAQPPSIIAYHSPSSLFAVCHVTSIDGTHTATEPLHRFRLGVPSCLLHVRPVSCDTLTLEHSTTTPRARSIASAPPPNQTQYKPVTRFRPSPDLVRLWSGLNANSHYRFYPPNHAHIASSTHLTP